jgi:hypothetical protein
MNYYKEVFMKKIKTLFGIATLVVIMLTFAACDLNLGYSESDFAGSTWKDGIAGVTVLRFINNSNWELSYWGVECGGTYEVRGSKIYFETTWGNRDLTARPDTLEIVDKDTLKYPPGLRLYRQ